MVSSFMPVRDVLSWMLMLVFVCTGIMNVVLIDKGVGIIYLLISLFYCPPLLRTAKERFGFTLPYLIRIIAAFVIIWMTLAVGDLAELYGL